MRYLKEGKWLDFNKNANLIFKKINLLNFEIDLINDELLENIKDCAVDLEKYETEFFSEFDVEYMNEEESEEYQDHLCTYLYELPSNEINLYNDYIEKLINIIDEEAFITYYTDKNNTLKGLFSQGSKHFKDVVKFCNESEIVFILEIEIEFKKIIMKKI